MSADLATLHAEELLRRDRDIASLRVALRDAQEANAALRAINDRLVRTLRLIELESERHQLAVKKAVELWEKA